jgi:hypothetical protein
LKIQQNKKALSAVRAFKNGCFAYQLLLVNDKLFATFSKVHAAFKNPC